MPRPSRALLTARHDPYFLRSHLLTAEKFQPYPDASDRSAWAALPTIHRAALVSDGEAALAQPWPEISATLWLDFVRNGARKNFEAAYFGRRQQLISLLIAECVEDRGRFLDAMANAVWSLCEETSWCLPAHLFIQALGPGLPDATEPVVDLFAAETAAALAWTDYLLGAKLDGVHPLVRARLRREVGQRVLTPCLTRDDFWWMGWQPAGRPVNNWNPWCNSNWLACVLLLESDPERRVSAVHKILRSLDFFIDHQPADGGCDEGPAYWGRAGASLFDCLELLQAATAGKLNLYAEPLVGETARYVMRAHIAGDWLLNFADAQARGAAESLLIWRFGRRIGDEALAAYGAWQHQRKSAPWVDRITSPGRLLANLFAVAEVESAPAAAPLLRDVWLPDLQVMVARDAAGTSDGFYLAAKGGHNEESHNHNDVGSFVVFLDGEPLLIDLGVETYAAKTFSPQRYEIWTMQSQWHNLPVVNGTPQKNGRAFAASVTHHHADDTAAVLQLDLTRAWPATAAIDRWTRTLRLERGQEIVITDEYQLRESRAPTAFHFITQAAPAVTAPGTLRLQTPTGVTALLHYDPERLEPAIETKEITDLQLAAPWGTSVHRVCLTERTPTLKARHEFRLIKPPAPPTR
jgi:hypothetical protein